MIRRSAKEAAAGCGGDPDTLNPGDLGQEVCRDSSPPDEDL